MAKYNKYVQIGPPTATAGAADTAMVKVCQKYPNVIAVLEDMGMPGIEWIKKKCHRNILSNAVLPKPTAPLSPAHWQRKDSCRFCIVFPLP